jgi:predicted DNA-binding transcriptional regulator AlpA
MEPQGHILTSSEKHKLDYYALQQRACSKVGAAKRNGLLTQKWCAICGAKKTEAHHHDYDKPYDVTWLCRKHHRLMHMVILRRQKLQKRFRKQEQKEMPGRLLTPRDLAKELGEKMETVYRWRKSGGGPTYIRISTRTVRYRREDVERWQQQNTVETNG